MPNPKRLIAIVGPTAVGKTAMAVKLAQHYKTVVVSADARQFYKEMSIGTAKPTIDEMDGVPHYFVDSHSIHTPISAGDYEREASALLDFLFERHDLIILVGGSGLFIKSLIEGLDEMPVVAPETRQNIENRLAEFGIDNLLEELKEKDLDFYNAVDKANHRRLIRALEIIHTSGKPFSSFKNKTKAERNYTATYIGLNFEREKLFANINQRVLNMFEAGLLEEAKNLDPYKHLVTLQTVGYSEIYPFLNNEYDFDEAVRLIQRNSRIYAKKQLTWFNKVEGVNWFKPYDFEEIVSFLG